MTDMHSKETDAEVGRALISKKRRIVRLPYAGVEWRGALLAISPYAGLLAMIVYFSVSTPFFLTLSNMQSIAQQAAVLLLVALGATFPILMGSIDLSVAGMVTLTGICTALLAQAGVNGVLLVIAVLAIGATAGLVNGVILAYLGLPSFLVTLGTSFVFTGVALLAIGGIPVPLQAPGLTSLVNGFTVGGIPNIALIALAVFAGSIGAAYWTTFGRYVYAIGGGEKVAVLAGISVKRQKALAFVVCGTLCGLAGILLAARLYSGSPGMGDPYLLSSIAAVVIGGTPLSGGVGGPQRTLLGVLLLGVLLDGMTLLSVGPFTQQIVEGLVVITAVALALRRRGEALVK